MLREEKGIGQQELCNFLGIEQSTLANYENDRRTPKAEMISKIADYFGTTSDYLLCRTDVKNPSDEISDALEDDKELADFWNKLKEREDLQLLFKQTKNLSSKDIKQIIRIIKAIEDEEDREGE
jgi:transcriptional regulator with XRE-family HTH domain